MSDTPKFCVDCKWHQCLKIENLFPYPARNEHMCNRSGFYYDVVTGNKHALINDCRSERDDLIVYGKPKCGPDAKFFEPKETK